MENFDTVGQSIKNMTKNAWKPMPKNVPMQSYGTLKLASFPSDLSPKFQNRQIRKTLVLLEKRA